MKSSQSRSPSNMMFEARGELNELEILACTFAGSTAGISNILQGLDQRFFETLMVASQDADSVPGGDVSQLTEAVAWGEAFYKFKNEKSHPWHSIIAANQLSRRRPHVFRSPHQKNYAWPCLAASAAVALPLVYLGAVSVVTGVKFAFASHMAVTLATLALGGPASVLGVLAFMILLLTMVAIGIAIGRSVQPIDRHFRLAGHLQNDILPLIQAIDKSITQVRDVSDASIKLDSQGQLEAEAVQKGLADKKASIKQDLESLRDSRYMRFFGRRSAQEKLAECLIALNPAPASP